jgi:hypothetical protein
LGSTTNKGISAMPTNDLKPAPSAPIAVSKQPFYVWDICNSESQEYFRSGLTTQELTDKRYISDTLDGAIINVEKALITSVDCEEGEEIRIFRVELIKVLRKPPDPPFVEI